MSIMLPQVPLTRQGKEHPIGEYGVLILAF
ncbi:MAG: hypothetical protein DF168_01143 [Candidatus Moanabacter tarae]|uniref:Uncharacterized protein n=1 Tax=Candidatus Moanibacter tarae TaxID=2200854 RepID=A0A2Z4AEQ1_9BACT|nr:MAG: hypothetical protein DF168_01143 [Candidatus Moanabacter tarae]